MSIYKGEITTIDDSLVDLDMIEIDDLLSSASRLLEEVCSSRPTAAAAHASATSSREDAMEQVQRFLSSIRENEEDEDVVFVAARPGNAPPAGARTTAIVDLCSPPNIGDEVSHRRRQSVNLEPLALPALNSTSPNCSNNTSIRRTKRQPKSEPVDKQQPVKHSPPKTRRGQTDANQLTPLSSAANNGNNGLPPLTCAICMDSVVTRQPCSTSCGHIFCQQCIFQSIRITAKCPLCNTKLNKSKVHRVYF